MRRFMLTMVLLLVVASVSQLASTAHAHGESIDRGDTSSGDKEGGGDPKGD